jgi:endonuclease/exonuclease/phosphatase family metal-dependent hydrolase
MRVRAATLNTWGLPEPFSRDFSARMGEIADRLPELGVDVMAFQEVWTADARRALTAVGPRAGLPYVWHNEASVGGSGLLVLSRFPIVEVRFERFRLRGDPEQLDQGEYLSGKGFARLRLATPEGFISVVDTHLHARYSTQASHQYRAHRIGQIVQLAMGLADIEDPLLVMGDFNFGEDDPEHAILTGLTGMRDAAAEVGERLPTVFRANPYRRTKKKPDRRIDLVFLRAGLQHRLQPRAVDRVFDQPFDLDGRLASCSDHAGVLADVELVREMGATSAHSPDRGALALAADWLRMGRSQAEQRRLGERTASCFGIGFAVLAAAGVHAPQMKRRKFLRVGLRTAALAALTPGVGLSVLSEGFRPDEIQAFDAAAAGLAQLERITDRTLAS